MGPKKRWLLRLTLLVSIAISSGSVSSAFLWGLSKIQLLPAYLIGLPTLGAALFYIQRFSFANASTNDLLKNIDDSKIKSELFTSPFILLSTWLSLLAGASVGREGTAVLIGGSVADNLVQKFSLSEEKPIWIRAGISAGFASVFGTPWAGCLFGLEISTVGKINLKSILPCLCSAILANYVSEHVWGTKHVIYPTVFSPCLSWLFSAKLISIGLFLGILGYIYKRSESIISIAYNKLPTQYNLKGILAGIILAIILFIPVFKETIGLGSQYLLRPFSQNVSTFAYLKLFATNLSLGLGFKGGEATPLFLIGSHAAGNLQQILSLPLTLLAAIGFVSLYAGLTNTPLTGTILGMELFGPSAWFCYLIGTLTVMYVSGNTSIFKSQTWTHWLPKPPYK